MTPRLMTAKTVSGSTRSADDPVSIACSRMVLFTRPPVRGAAYAPGIASAAVRGQRREELGADLGQPDVLLVDLRGRGHPRAEEADDQPGDDHDHAHDETSDGDRVARRPLD